MLTVGSIPTLAIRLVIPWRGAWIADCDLDLASDQTLPTGVQSLTVGTTTLTGTVDARATGRFGEKARARIVAGAAGWGSTVKKQDFHNDAPNGVSSSMVYQATAAQIGETVSDPSPVGFGSYFERLEGRASSIFDAACAQPARDWYVDAKGITNVQPWPTLSLGSDALVHAYDPELRVAHLTADEIVWPGTTITDPRFGTLTARDVDQRFTAEGSRLEVYHSTAALGRLDAALETLIRSFAGTEYAKQYEYRIASTNADGRLSLQAVRTVDGIPDTLPIPVWPGLPGMSATFTGAQVGLSVRVIFLGGDKTRPLVVGFDGRPATTMVLDAFSSLVLGGPTSRTLADGQCAQQLVTAVTDLNSAVSGLATAMSALTPGSTPATFATLNTLGGNLTAALAAVTAALAAISKIQTVKVKAE